MLVTLTVEAIVGPYKKGISVISSNPPKVADGLKGGLLFVY